LVSPWSLETEIGKNSAAVRTIFRCESLQNVEVWQNLSAWSGLAEQVSVPLILRGLLAGFITFAFLASLGFIHALWALLQARLFQRAFKLHLHYRSKPSDGY